MPEWLTTDPLNGIVVTITFFISLIIGRYLREKRSQSGYRGRMIDSRIRIFVAFILIIAMTVMKNWHIPVIISILCIFIALRLGVFRDYTKKIIFPLVLALFILAIQGLTYGVNIIDLGFISVYSEGIEYGSLIFARVFASASVLVLLVITTPENELLGSMRWFGVPRTIIEICSLMTRYIRTFSYEGKKLKLAQESRCGFSREQGFTKRMHNIASICGLLITRAFARSEEIYIAMISRAWRPGLKYPGDYLPLDKKDIMFGLVLSFGIIGLIGLDRFL